jgi:polysaccharide export outer membrane protein
MWFKALRIGFTSRRTLSYWGAFLLCGSLFSPVRAQVSRTAAASQSDAVGATEDAAPKDLSSAYQLGPEDKLLVTVARHPEMSGEALVLNDGTINLPRIGSVKVQGKTLAEAQALLLTEYGKILVQPDVTVAIVTPRVETVLVFGAVENPGPVGYKEGWRITDGIAQAGGIKLRPDWVTLTVTHKDGIPKKLSVEDLMKHPDDPDNEKLVQGDVLMIQEIPPQQVFIGGKVAKPGMYDIRDVDPKPGSLGVLEALALAGGPAPDAALSKAVIFRSGKTEAKPDAARREEIVNLYLLQQTAKTASAVGNAQNGSSNAASRLTEPQLYPGDTLQIPESTAKIVVMGKVKTPGTFPISEDHPTTLAQAIGLAGGTDPRANLDKVGIVRMKEAEDGAAPKPILLTANLQDLFKKQDTRQNMVLQPGDVVYVPETKKPDWFGKVLPGLSSVASALYFATVAAK